MAARIDIEITKGSSFLQVFTKYDEQFITFRSTWTDLTQYNVDDVVIYKNASYICILDTTNKQNPTDVTYWGDLNPHDYSTSTFEAKIRTAFNEEAPIIVMAVGFVNDGTDGKLKMELTPAETAALDFDEAVYDLEITTGTTVYKEISGKVILIDEVTR